MNYENIIQEYNAFAQASYRQYLEGLEQSQNISIIRYTRLHYERFYNSLIVKAQQLYDEKKMYIPDFNRFLSDVHDLLEQLSDNIENEINNRTFSTPQKSTKQLLSARFKPGKALSRMLYTIKLFFV